MLVWRIPLVCMEHFIYIHFVTVHGLNCDSTLVRPKLSIVLEFYIKDNTTCSSLRL